MHNELESKKGSNLSSMSENNDLNEKLVISKAKYRALFENVPVGIFQSTPGGKILTANRMLLQMLGYDSKKEFMNLNIARDLYTSPQDRQLLLKELEEKGEIRNTELTLKRKDGTQIIVWECSHVLKDKRGKVFYYEGILTDITERKSIEAALEKYQRHLEDIVKQRTTEIQKINEQLRKEIDEHKKTEKALRKISEELKRSNVELQQFAYVASHDLQEPLRMISSYTQLLERRYKGKLDADANEFISFIVVGVSRMQNLINDLLSYSRLGSHKKDFTPTDCNIICDRVLANLKVTIQENEAVILKDPLPVVMGDGLLLSQLFQNLISNAIKFRSTDRPRIEITAAPQKKEWIFKVKDNGIGIAPEFHERIFIIFQRLHGRAEFPGTGIGLAICKKVVELHGGRIWVESNPGQGSTFFFTLPAAEENSI